GRGAAMTSFYNSLFLASLVGPFTVMALGAGLQVATPDQSPPTTLEQALIDYACGPQVGDVRQACLTNQLLTLRTNFGRDLRRLSASERNTVDAACSRDRETLGREGYVACLSGQLTALSRRRSRGTTPPPQASAPPAAPAAAAPSAPPPAQPSLLSSA